MCVGQGTEEKNLMQSFIISSKNLEKGVERARTLSSEKNINEFDITLESFEKAIGIEDIRSIQKNLYLKPMRGEFKSIILNIDKEITATAQNALLKILEEPPPSTSIFLVIPDSNTLLPTILSRCKVIKIEDKFEISDDDIKYFRDLAQKFTLDNLGIKLKLAQDISGSREEAVAWLEKAILVFHKIMIENLDAINYQSKVAAIIKKLEEGHRAAKNTNVNQRFILENTLLSI